MTHVPPTVEEMLAEDEEREPLGTRAALDAITRTVREDDVVVTVDLHGKLVGLDLGERAMGLRPAALAARLNRLTAVAAEAALAAGAEVLAAVLDEPAAAELGLS
ncbi:hypothetical protein SAMN05216188_13015 [Lentzea xinjiangensis]|uniref:YbaB/EbfC DNA-binding family protein n=1 Tax=Lentzea xinjiangensis TaxID=402600 RepID=A0A1H9W215_9PSEU|nr:hypothetical protein [Lentzea xinjiangensis]SES27966.1 hypothetical protein SAMN05216188_13015 [Lentzea xinjiangensis]